VRAADSKQSSFYGVTTSGSLRFTPSGSRPLSEPGPKPVLDEHEEKLGKLRCLTLSRLKVSDLGLIEFISYRPDNKIEIARLIGIPCVEFRI
jgi:hypothetical protein